MSTASITRRMPPKYGISADRLRAQKPAKPATTLAGIQARIDRASRRAEALRRSLLADGAQWLPNAEALRGELKRIESDLVTYWADKRRVLAADEMGGWW